MTVTGSGVVDVHVYRQAGPKRLLVHLVNCSNADLFQPPAEEIVPVGPQAVTLRLSRGERVDTARLLWRGEILEVTREGSVVTATVPGVDAYEVVVFPLE